MRTQTIMFSEELAGTAAEFLIPTVQSGLVNETFGVHNPSHYTN